MICYGIGDITANLYLKFISLFMIVFYTDVLGIPATIAGIIAMLSRFFDGVNDMFIGYLSDRTGHYKRWIWWGSIVTAITFVIMFTNFDLSPQKQIVFALVSFCIWTLMYTTYAIPFNAFASTMTQSTEERTKLNAIRFAIVAIPTLIISIATPYLKSGQNGGDSYSKTALLFAILATICCYICVRNVVDRSKKPGPKQRTGAKEYFRTVFGNKQLLIISLAFFLCTLASTIYNAAMPYFFNYHFNSPQLMSVILFLDAFISAIAALSVPFIAAKIGKKKSLLICGYSFVVASMLRFFVPGSAVVVIVTSIVCAFMLSARLALFFTMVADTTDYGMWMTGKNVRAINYGFYTFSQKCGMAMGASIVGIVLDLFHYVPNEVQTPIALTGILVVYCVIPAVLMLLMSCTVHGWKLNESFMHKIVQELNSKTEEAQQANS